MKKEKNFMEQQTQTQAQVAQQPPLLEEERKKLKENVKKAIHHQEQFKKSLGEVKKKVDNQEQLYISLEESMKTLPSTCVVYKKTKNDEMNKKNVGKEEQQIEANIINLLDDDIDNNDDKNKKETSKEVEEESSTKKNKDLPVLSISMQRLLKRREKRQKLQ